MNLGDPALWAEAGGLLGLAIFGVFVTTVGSWIMLARKDNKHSDFVSKIIEDDREDRAKDRLEHSQTTNKLAEAINDLTRELRNRDR